MITAKAFAGKHYAVYGLARSGIATVEALLASGARVTAWDAKEEARAALSSLPSHRSAAGPSLSHWERERAAQPRKGEVDIANLDEADLTQFDSLVVTPGLPLNRHPIAQRARNANLEIIGDIELFARARPGLPPHKVVGITGTNGKSTTTALVHHILKTAGEPATMGGNIGLPILAQEPLPEGGVYVLELSSYQIDLTQSLDCDIAVLLNITPDHLDRYESFEAYAASKWRLFAMQSRGGVPVLCVDDPAIALAAEHWWDRFPHTAPGLPSAKGNEYRQLEWPTLQGPHNLQNARAAETVAAHLQTEFGFSISRVNIDDAFRTYPGLPHRMERVREKDDVLFVNDSKATNPTATAPALAAFPAIRWILGGQAKTDSLDECAPHFGHVRSAYTIGEAGELFARLLGGHMPVEQCETLENAVNRAAEDSLPGDTVLLSPACASFDQFRDFEARGDRFKELVGAL